jgi:CHAT domain-containing protein/cytochrome c-type biogenesis protein CcmH/NrfG
VELRLLTDANYIEELDIIADELIDLYANDRVSAEERERLEQFFFQSPERREKLRFALALKTRASELKGRNRRSRRLLRLYLPIAAAILLAAGVGFWRAFLYQSDVSKGLVALRTVYGQGRPVESRVTDFGYAPTAQSRGAGDTNPLRRELAGRLLINAVVERPDAESHHALGQYYIAVHQFDDAVEQLKASLSLDPQNAKAHCDLGVALMERGKSRGPEKADSIQDYGESLQHLDRALELDNSQLEALFNRALLHQYMLLPNQAVDDWRAYLAKDPDSGWAKEARQYLKTLEEQQQSHVSLDDGQAARDFLSAYVRKDEERCKELINRSYTSAGNTITNTLIDHYLDAGTGGEGTEENSLDAVTYIAQLESRSGGDSYTSELMHFYRQANPDQRLSLVRARRQMKRGYERFLHSESNEALTDLEQALLAFNKIGDEQESILAEYLIGLCYLWQLDLTKTESIFQRLQVLCKERKYEWLHAQILYRRGMLRQNDNKLSEAIEYDLQALEKFERIKDSDGILKVLINLADEYESLNDVRQSMAFLQRGLSLAGQVNPQPSQVWGLYTAMGLNFNALGLMNAALAYQKEALGIALKMGLPLYVARSQAYLGMTYGNLRLYDEALSHIGQALNIGSMLSGETSGQEMVANASLYAGEIYRQRGDQSHAIDAYDRAIDFYAGLNFPYFRYMAHKGKLLSLLARDDDPSTKDELTTVLKIFEQYRIDLTREGQRNTFFDVEQGVYDRVMDFTFTKKKDARLAFDYSELSRARSLLDAMRQGVQVAGGARGPDLRLVPGMAPQRMSEIQQRMPERAQIVQYAVLEDKTLVWLITRSDVTAEEINVGSHNLEEKVQAYLQALKESPTDQEHKAERDAKELYEILLKPLEHGLTETKLLCIVPDKILHYLPFAALISNEKGSYLVEDFQLEMAPSSTVFVECSELAKLKANAKAETLLSVGDPSFDRKSFPDLQPLSSAGMEARGITAFYKSSYRLLTGGEATEKAVTSEIGKYDVINFALHYVVNEQSNMLSGMVLAGEHVPGVSGDDDGLWQVFEIYKAQLPQTRLVVLSACQTGLEKQNRGEGSISVVRPFITAGVPIVVASLWAVNSDSTARLIANFHRYRTLERAPTAEALRRAQLALLKGDDERYRQPYYWAAFTAIGGYTEF